MCIQHIETLRTEGVTERNERPKSCEADEAKTNMEKKGERVNERVKEGKKSGQRGIEDG